MALIQGQLVKLLIADLFAAISVKPSSGLGWLFPNFMDTHLSHIFLFCPLHLGYSRWFMPDFWMSPSAIHEVAKKWKAWFKYPF